VTQMLMCDLFAVAKLLVSSYPLTVIVLNLALNCSVN